MKIIKQKIDFKDKVDVYEQLKGIKLNHGTNNCIIAGYHSERDLILLKHNNRDNSTIYMDSNSINRVEPRDLVIESNDYRNYYWIFLTKIKELYEEQYCKNK